MKTKKELDKIKEEVRAVNEKISELTEEELETVVGGNHCGIYIGTSIMIHAPIYGETFSSAERLEYEIDGSKSNKKGND